MKRSTNYVPNVNEFYVYSVVHRSTWYFFFFFVAGEKSGNIFDIQDSFSKHNGL